MTPYLQSLETLAPAPCRVPPNQYKTDPAGISAGSISSSVSDTGFIPPVSLEEGLARTLRYEFIEDNLDKQY